MYKINTAHTKEGQSSDFIPEALAGAFHMSFDSRSLDGRSKSSSIIKQGSDQAVSSGLLNAKPSLRLRSQPIWMKSTQEKIPTFGFLSVLT